MITATTIIIVIFVCFFHLDSLMIFKFNFYYIIIIIIQLCFTKVERDVAPC